MCKEKSDTVIIRENTLKVEDVSENLRIKSEAVKCGPEEMIFFDLEHYVYKKPKCIGVFGACIFDKRTKTLKVTQYMIENRYEVVDILYLAKNYFIHMKNIGKSTIVTFSGNNDFTVINYLFEKYSIDYKINELFHEIDIQKEYEREKSKSIGLKNLEKQFGIIRESELISGSNLAKTFHKVMKDKDYISRMPKEKVEKILLYNEQDVINLYHIFNNWDKFINNPYITEGEEVKELEFDKDDEKNNNDEVKESL